MDRRGRWLALGAVVLLALSFRPWFVFRASIVSSGQVLASEQSRNAWEGSPLWAAAILAGVLAAILVWFATPSVLDVGSRRRLVRVLLLAGALLLVRDWRPVSEPGVSFVTRIGAVGDVELDAPVPEWASEAERFQNDLRPVRYVALATLLAMWSVAGRVQTRSRYAA